MGDQRVPGVDDVTASARGSLRRCRAEVRRQCPVPAGRRHARVGVGFQRHRAGQAQPVRIQRLRPQSVPVRERLRHVRRQHRRHGEVHQGLLPDAGRSLVGWLADAAEHAAVLVLLPPVGCRGQPDRELDPPRHLRRPRVQVCGPGRARRNPRRGPDLGAARLGRRPDPPGGRVRRAVGPRGARRGHRRGGAARPRRGSHRCGGGNREPVAGQADHHGGRDTVAYREPLRHAPGVGTDEARQVPAPRRHARHRRPAAPGRPAGPRPGRRGPGLG